MQRDDLKACPCCGSRDVVLIDDWDDPEDGICMTIRCNNCLLMLAPEPIPSDDSGDMYMPDSDEYDEFLCRKVDTWNTRKTAAVRSKDILKLTKELMDELMPLANVSIPSQQMDKIGKIWKELEGLDTQVTRERSYAHAEIQEFIQESHGEQHDSQGPITAPTDSIDGIYMGHDIGQYTPTREAPF